MTYKFCKTCGVSKPLEEYTPHKRGLLGRVPHCRPCSADRAKRYRKENLEKTRSYDREWKRKKVDKRKAAKKKREEYAKNPSKYKERCRRYYLANKDVFFDKAKLREKRVKEATPRWLSDKQKEGILAMYRLRDKLQAITGTEYHVDHIEPIQSETICGLHVPWNLQILEKSLNLAKGNKR